MDQINSIDKKQYPSKEYTKILTHVHEPRNYPSKTSIGSLHGIRTDYWWTGLKPDSSLCPGVEKNGFVYSLPQFSFLNGKTTREDLQKYFDNTWTLTEVLLGSLQGEDAFHVPPYHDLRHPLIFYYGHPAALYINKLRVAGLLKEPINQYYEVIFETGVDEVTN